MPTGTAKLTFLGTIVTNDRDGPLEVRLVHDE